MTDIPVALFLNVAVYLWVPFICGYIAKKLKLQPLIGYIIGGIILGNFIDPLVSKAILNQFAYFGILLLLFSIGLEINFGHILLLKKFIITAGILQIVLSAVFIGLLSLCFHFSFVQSLLIGLVFSSSSTALVAKIIQERKEETTFVGEIVLGVLMLQDLAFIPIVFVFNFLNGSSGDLVLIGIRLVVNLVIAGIVLFLMYYVGKKVIPLIFDKVASTSRELLNLFIIFMIFFICFISAFFHVPIFIGMFIAGVVISQTNEHYHIFSQIRALRDILSVIFFVFMGSNIIFGRSLLLLPQILLFALLVLAVKFFIIISAFIFLRFHSKTSFSFASYLFGLSESSFVLIALPVVHQLFSPDQTLILTATILVGLLLTPVCIENKNSAYTTLRSMAKKVPFIDLFIKHTIDYDYSMIEPKELHNHIIICGYGRVGSHIGRALHIANIPFVAIDYNYHTLAEAKKDAIPIIYGDPTDIEILQFAKAEKAVAIIIVIPDLDTQESVIFNAKKLNPHIVVISRANKRKDRQRIKDLGARVVVEPELEASLSIIKKIFILKGRQKQDILNHLRYFKLEQGYMEE